MLNTYPEDDDVLVVTDYLQDMIHTKIKSHFQFAIEKFLKLDDFKLDGDKCKTCIQVETSEEQMMSADSDRLTGTEYLSLECESSSPSSDNTKIFFLGKEKWREKESRRKEGREKRDGEDAHHDHGLRSKMRERKRN